MEELSNGVHVTDLQAAVVEDASAVMSIAFPVHAPLHTKTGCKFVWSSTPSKPSVGRAEASLSNVSFSLIDQNH